MKWNNKSLIDLLLCIDLKIYENLEYFEIFHIILLLFLSKSNCFELLQATGLFEIQFDFETQFPLQIRMFGSYIICISSIYIWFWNSSDSEFQISHLLNKSLISNFHSNFKYFGKHSICLFWNKLVIIY